jgi:succinate dehydrogenase / fumarate reductase cytochrome b subunit
LPPPFQLTKANREARQDKYGMQKAQVSSKSSHIMIWSGLTILAFIVYHLLHFTVRVGNDYATYKTVLHGETVHDVYRMVIAGFSWAPASIFYIIAMLLLSSHLSHGFSSLFQTLGIATDKTEPLFKKARLCLRWPDPRRQLLHPHRHPLLRLRPLIFFRDSPCHSILTFPPARWP